MIDLTNELWELDTMLETAEKQADFIYDSIKGVSLAEDLERREVVSRVRESSGKASKSVTWALTAIQARTTKV